MRVFKQVATYTPYGSTESSSIEFFETASQKQEASGATVKTFAKIVVEISALTNPQYRDKVTIDSQDWYVEKVSTSQDADFWELDIRRDEKLVYGK